MKRLLLFVIFLISPVQVFSTPVTFNFIAEVSFNAGGLAFTCSQDPLAACAKGDKFQGSYTFDSTVTGIYQDEISVGDGRTVYTFNGPPSQITADLNGGFIFDEFVISIRNDAPFIQYDEYVVNSGGSFAPSFQLYFAAPFGVPMLSSTDLPLVPFSLDGLINAQGGIVVPVNPHANTLLEFQVKSLTLLNAVPIPAAFPLFGSALGLMGFIGWRRKKAA